MQLLHYASGFLAISQLLFMGCFYLIYYPRHLLGRLLAFFSLCVVAYILVRMPETGGGVFGYLLQLLAVLAPALLWIIARLLFVDQRAVPFGMALLVVAYIVLRAVGMVFYDGSQGRDSWFFRIFYDVPQLVMLILAGHVVLMACRDRAGDLIESRRRLRVPFALGMGSIVGLIVASGFFLSSSTVLDILYFSTIFVLILFLNLATFRLHRDSPQLLLTAAEQPRMSPAEKTPALVDNDGPMIRRINEAMEQQRLYTEPGLTIGDLAARLSLQEYRLRRLINQRLHYRNFNQYLNHYRIRDAAERLQDPEQDQVSISTIALEVGYASLSSFNKAFKDAYGVTPSGWRAQGRERNGRDG